MCEGIMELSEMAASNERFGRREGSMMAINRANTDDEGRRHRLVLTLISLVLSGFLLGACAGDGSATQSRAEQSEGTVIGVVPANSEAAPLVEDTKAETEVAIPQPAAPSKDKGSKKRRGKGKDKEVAVAAKEAGAAASVEPVLKLGPGDSVNIAVFGRPEFDTTTYISDNGTINVPLAGEVEIGGGSPADAARKVAAALKKGQFLVNPQVTITLDNFRSQQVSILGDVRNPGRFPIESKTSVLDLLALAGGPSETGGDIVYLIRTDEKGQQLRYPVNVRSLGEDGPAASAPSLRGGDTVFVPKAEQYFVYGEVQTPNKYRLDPNTTVLEAISQSGGLTSRGSQRRIVIKRRQQDGGYKTFDAELTDVVKPDDVILVKERIF